MVDKNQATIDYLLTCPQIKSNPLFFNAINAKDNDKQFVTMGNSKSLNKPYIDGSVLKRYTFTVVDFKSITFQAIVKVPNRVSENVQDVFDTQSIIDWIDEQNDLRNFPNFGNTCIIDSIKVLTDNPTLNGIDSSASASLAKYSFSVQIDYLDVSKVIWT